jgi:hypothetical protein
VTAIIKQATGIQRLDVALGVLRDPNANPDDKAAAYSLLWHVQIVSNRAMRAAKDDLIVHMEREGLRDMGPLSIKATAIDVRWPANDEGNWIDSDVQEAMELYAKVAPEYFRHVPDHWEVDTAALGAGMAEGDPVAKRLHRECKDKGWRTEAGRRLSLAVREPRRKDAAA